MLIKEQTRGREDPLWINPGEKPARTSESGPLTAMDAVHKNESLLEQCCRCKSIVSIVGTGKNGITALCRWERSDGGTDAIIGRIRIIKI